LLKILCPPGNVLKELRALHPMPFTQPYITHATVTPTDQRRMEEASGFKPSSSPQTATDPFGEAQTKSALARLVEYVQDNTVLQVVLVVLCLIVLAVVAKLLGR